MQQETAQPEATNLTSQPLYKPLVGDEIRLLTLLSPFPATAEDPIHCSLEALSQSDYSPEYNIWHDARQTQTLPHETLRQWKEHLKATTQPSSNLEQDLELDPSWLRHSWGDYIALSYTWGSSEQPKHIILNGRPYPVTANLDASLRNVHSVTQTQSSNGPIRIWADAICINQQDKKEQAHEIKRMRAIFAEALGVVVALGNGWEGCDAAFDFIRDVSPLVHTGLTYIEFKQNAAEHRRFKDSIVAILKLLCHPYWRRVWVIQEIAVGADPVIIACGKSKLLLEQWRTFCVFMFTEIRSIEPDGVLPGPWTDYHTINDGGLLLRFDVLRSVSRAMEAHKTATFIELGIAVLSLGIMGIATDPRDQIYGLLGLLPKNILDRIVVNYSTSEYDVFADFSKLLIEEMGQLDVITFRPQAQMSKPSWVTDWTKRFDRYYLFYERCFNYDVHAPSSNVVRRPLYGIDKRRVSSRADKHCRKPISFSCRHNYEYLHCHGFRIGEVDGFSAEALIMTSPVSANPTEATQPSTTANPYVDAKDVLRTLIATISQNPSSHSASDTSAFADIPWCGAEADADAAAFTFTPGAEFRALITQLATQAPWTRGNLDHIGCFEMIRRALGTFLIGGKPLKDYFPSAEAGYRLDHLKEECIADISHLTASMIGRRLAVLLSGHMALVPAIVEKGDEVWVLYGASMPILTRRCKDVGHSGGCRQVVSECYVEGFMGGEGVDAVEKGEYVPEEVTIC